jgi:hypothetical protein
MASRALSWGITAALASALGAGALGCEVSAYPENYYVEGDYPPADWIATTEPVYFEGHAAYWYHGRWCYRDGNRWSSYQREPPALAQHRAQYGAPARRNYARPSTIRSTPTSRGGHR